MASDTIIPLSSLKLIGIHGKAGAGKTTVAEYLSERFAHTYNEAFADPLKAACAAAFHIDIENFQKSELKQKYNPFWKMTHREMLQLVGTEGFRQANSNMWIHSLEGRLRGILDAPSGEGYYKESDTVLISDVRFQNEYNWIIDNRGDVIHIIRPKSEEEIVGIPGHSSERSLNLYANFKIHLLENNSTLEDLYDKVIVIANQLGLKDKNPDPFPL